MLVELGSHPRHLRFRQGVNAEGLHQLVHPPSGNPGEVAVGDHRDQSRLGTLPALQQPLGEVGALTQFRDCDIDRASPSVEVAVAVAVAVRKAVRARLPPFGADHSVGVSGQQGVDHGLQQMPHQIGRRVTEGFTEHRCRVDNVGSGHRVDAFREGCRRFLEGSHGDRVHVSNDVRDHRGLHHYAGLHYGQNQQAPPRKLGGQCMARFSIPRQGVLDKLKALHCLRREGSSHNPANRLTYQSDTQVDQCPLVVHHLLV